MNSAEYVSKQIEELKKTGQNLQWVAWQVARLCLGWAYVYGARGEFCTPVNRRTRYRADHPTIKTACKNFDGAGSCSGCKWFPDGQKTRFFDCRGFTYWVLLQVYGFKLAGAGATSQWNTATNWRAKGAIAEMPRDTLCCLFVRKGTKMEHTGFGVNGETIECGAGVTYSAKRNKKWTDWAVPACVTGTMPPSPTPSPDPDPDTRPTLRRGSSGPYVTLAQTELIQKGYDCGSFGADGEFGAATEKAVRLFQRDHTDQTGKPLTVDGVIGSRTWWALDQTEPSYLYTVTVPHLSKSQADALIREYPGATKTQERG